MNYADAFSQEHFNLADSWERELLNRHNVRNLSDLSESDLNHFRYTGNIHVEAPAFQLLRCRYFQAKRIPFTLNDGRPVKR